MNRNRPASFGWFCISIAIAFNALTTPGLAWHAKGHHRVTRLAVESLSDEVPWFFRGGVATIAHCSIDPDVFTRPIAPEALHRAEAPQHYFDIERLGGMEVPPYRYELLMWCGKKDIYPSNVGLLPYAIVEWTQRLSVAYAEHITWPDNPHIRSKVLVYAGILGHYAGDLCMPLHTTIHYDGRAKPDGSSPKSGIHLKTDDLIGKLSGADKITIDRQSIQPFDDLFGSVLAELTASHALVDRVYELEAEMPAYGEPLKPDGAVARFAAERLKAAARFTARLYLTAWRDAAKIKLPEWHRRPADGAVPTTRD